MNAYPHDYVVHNLPLILLSGLEGNIQNDAISGEKTRAYLGEGGFRIRAELPPVEGFTAKALQEALLSRDSSKAAWHAQPLEKGVQKHAFSIRSVGRTYTLPPRKAPPPAHSPRLQPAADSTSPPLLVLHSTLSPLTPSSPLYPDGIITPVWITKHQSRLPSVFVSFYILTSDANTSSLQDNRIKSEIHEIRNVINSTNYKTRFAVVLLGDGAIRQSDLEDRLMNIRRAANLDLKTLFYLPHNSAQTEIAEFANSLLSTLHPTSIEYYRDLSKHARRKRNRSTIPPPTIPPSSGTSSPLNLQGWNVRYEFKLAVFAEFRQEMEAACRNYEAAYEALFGPEVFESIPSWSPKFKETRLLSDIIAFRIIRCLLWSSQTSAAVRTWLNHRNRIRDLIDRRGAGSENYGWEAWQSTWSKTMAELVGRAEISFSNGPNPSNLDTAGIYINPEKMFAQGERLMPWEYLHHRGYWLNLAQRYTQNRRSRALQMPEEDRAPPGHSPASTIASKAHTYDTYLTLEPHEELPIDGLGGYDYMKDVSETLDTALEQFSSRDQERTMQILWLKKAAELSRTASWLEASEILKKIWTGNDWRNAGWWGPLLQVGQALLSCANELQDYELAAQIRWELDHVVTFQSPQSRKTTIRSPPNSDIPAVALDHRKHLSCLFPSFAFASAEGHVGEQVKAQMSLRYLGVRAGARIAVSEVKVVFDGGIKPILLFSKNSKTLPSPIYDQIVDVQLVESSGDSVNSSKASSMSRFTSWTAEADLLLSSGTTTVFNLSMVPREAGQVTVASITVSVLDQDYNVTVTASEIGETSSPWWETRNGRPKSRDIGKLREASLITILPKPPKVEILIPNFATSYYTNEDILLDIRVLNQEESNLSGTLECRLISPHKSGVQMSWADHSERAEVSEGESAEIIQVLPTLHLGEMMAGSSNMYSLHLTNSTDAVDHELELVVSYTLLADPETPLKKIVAIDIPVIRPFEANAVFNSRIHEEPWQSFFSPPEPSLLEQEPSGLKQKYLVNATLASFAQDTLQIQSVKLVSQKIVGNAIATCSLGRLRSPEPESPDQKPLMIETEQTKQFEFNLIMQKLTLGDRLPVTADFKIEVEWCRPATDRLNISTLALAKFLSPMSEPRVLLRTSKVQDKTGVYQLVYTIENPSMHFLTFNLAMESSEDFAFSGSKSKTISLTPISRYDLVYQILLYKSKEWVKVHLEVLDAYFGQTLKVQPACDAVKIDKQGVVLLWVD